MGLYKDPINGQLYVYIYTMYIHYIYNICTIYVQYILYLYNIYAIYTISYLVQRLIYSLIHSSLKFMSMQ